jgi:uncharacterized protein YbjT (DUF2867 family)
MILITGATGTIGREVTRLLAARGEQVRAMTRDLARARTLPAGVEVVRGDFSDHESLACAAAGAKVLFLLSAPGPSMILHDTAMLAAAQAAGVGKVVKLSAIGTGEKADTKVGDWHLPGEQAVRSSGMEWTVLRPSSFASNTLRWAASIQAGDPIPNTMATGVEGVVDPRDVAEVAARARTSADHGGLYTLTGPELLSVPDLALVLGEVLGRTVATVDISLEAYRERLLASGLDPAFVEVAVNGSRLVAEGGNARLTGEVEQVLGRPPRTFTTWAYDHRAAFAR